MSRILIFDNQNKYNFKSDGGPSDQDGTAIGSQFDLSAAESVSTAVRSDPVRCFGGEEETRLVGVEFLLTDIETSPQAFAFRWWPEFYSDKPALTTPPSNRDWLGVDPRVPWGRPVSASDAGSGAININPIQYQMTMQDRLSIDGYPSDCIYMPLSVHALWMRIAIWVDYSNSTGVTGPTLVSARLRIFAIAGNHNEHEYLEENGDKIYVYNGYK